MAAFADDDDAAAVDAILKQAPSSKIPELLDEASKRGLDVRSEELAAALDEADPLREYRQQFCFPPPHNGRDAIYLCGHSLGLQPKKTKQAVLEDLERWARYGVEGHFDQDDAPSTRWWTIEDCAEEEASRLVGAQRSEVVLMNSLTVNLHLLLSAFYRPEGSRRKILIEAHAFPSDEYAVQSCVSSRGGSEDDIVRVEGGTDDLVEAINTTDGLCVVLIGAVQYYSGEWFDARKLARATHEKGALLGLDCAHAAGNVPLQLHEHDVDFACWCSYKYLNSGPGAIAGAFVHSKHDTRSLPGALRGWWGHERSTRFEMNQEPVYRAGAAGLQLSNPPTLPMVALREAYKLHDAASISMLRAKSLKLTAYLELLLALEHPSLEIVTPRDPMRRGAQLSIKFNDGTVEGVFARLQKMHIFADLRRPDVLRVAPAPLYNCFGDVRAFVEALTQAVHEEELGGELEFGGEASAALAEGLEEAFI